VKHVKVGGVHQSPIKRRKNLPCNLHEGCLWGKKIQSAKHGEQKNRLGGYTCLHPFRGGSKIPETRKKETQGGEGGSQLGEGKKVRKSKEVYRGMHFRPLLLEIKKDLFPTREDKSAQQRGGDRGEWRAKANTFRLADGHAKKKCD